MKRKIAGLLTCLTAAALLSTVPVNAANNPYPSQQDVDEDGFYEVPCTRFAWQQVYDNEGIALPAWGNAGEWYSSAQKAGYSTGNIPKAGAVAVWTDGGAGHVAYVTSVQSDTTFTVNEGGRVDLDETSSHGVTYGYKLTNAVGQRRPGDPGKTLVGFIYPTGGDSGNVNPPVTNLWKTSDNEDGSVTITGYDGTADDITIPDTINGKKVTKIGFEAFIGRENLRAVDIPGSVTEIGSRAFWNCTGLSSVTLHDGLEQIHGNAFYNCESLTSITIPSTVTNYNYNENDGAFAWCDNLKKAVIAEGSIDVGWNLFKDCTGLEEVTIPDTVTEIYYNAFYNCPNLKSIDLPENLRYLGRNSLFQCSSLKTLEIPAKVNEIDEAAFKDCDNLESVNVDQKNETYASLDGVLYDKNLSKVVAAPGNIKSVSIPESVVSIGNYAFYDCKNLPAIEIPDSVKDIGIAAFTGCSKVRSIVIPYGVEELRFWTFDACSSLKSIEIPVTVKTIGAAGFAMFDDCDSLTDIYYGGSKEDWEKISIPSGKERLQSVTIHYNSKIPTGITNIAIMPVKNTIIRGRTQQLAVKVSGAESIDTSVTWKVSGNTSAKTMISKDGVLKIGSDEKSKTLKVTATSVEDTSKSDTVTVKVQMFKDVDEYQFFSDAVNWGTEHNAVSGYSEQDGTSSFRPNDICTRAQFVTFLWRTLGEKNPTSTKNPFKDIKDIGSQYYGTALLWAYENKYVSGYSDPDGVRFGPDDQITRGQVVTFLWRAAGSPKPKSSKSTFVDVKDPSKQYYGQAMLWASENGVVSGYSDAKGSRFAADDSCTRGQVVTFLWRYAQKYLK